MKKVLGLATLAALGISLFSNVPAQAQYTSLETGNDFVCRFRHRVEGEDWMTATASGTTRLQARDAQGKILDRLENQAADSGSEFEVVHLGCTDPFGND